MRRLALSLLLLCLAAGHSSAAGTQRNFVVFFQKWSAAFDDPALRVIAEAARWAKSHPDAQVSVTGAADRTGSRQANILLSELRAQVVADQLAADGADPRRIKQMGLGSVDYALSSQESRRVVISFPPP
ncbi:MAG TPA: OmpA family protein [Acetobacteraceae bacterium]|nr:OmpA family protein [Acetobacteraceae bacterium]